MKSLLCPSRTARHTSKYCTSPRWEHCPPGKQHLKPSAPKQSLTCL